MSSAQQSQTTESDALRGLQRTTTDGVVAADQQTPEPLTLLVGPTTSGEFNTIEERLVPKGCFRVDDIRFEFDSSFVSPEVAQDMPLLADLRDKHKHGEIMPPLSIFGHADPVGNDDYNKLLSGRRAQAIYALLVRDGELWEELFTTPFGRDNWGNQAIQTMLAAVGHSPGPIDGNMGQETNAAVKTFQQEKGLTVDGVVGPETRKALYRAYMDFLCGPRLELDKERDFLARHRDSGGKGDFQGCSEFNPVLMFSAEENARFGKAADKTERNQENAPNRRVMILLFAPGRRVTPAFWPCPRAKEGVAACKKRFHSDAERRRTFQSQRREFKDTKDTFACRFYQIISDDSPCEKFLGLITFKIRLFDPFRKAIPSARFRVTVGQQTHEGKADGQGFVEVRDVEVPNRCLVEWGHSGGEGFPFQLELHLDFDQAEDEQEQARGRLNNLGYPSDLPLEQNIKAFQRDYRLLGQLGVQEGALDPITKAKLLSVHDSAEADPGAPLETG